MPQVQDRSLNLLTSSPACYHCATDAPTLPLPRKNYLQYKNSLQLDYNTIQSVFYHVSKRCQTGSFGIKTNVLLMALMCLRYTREMQASEECERTFWPIFHQDGCFVTNTSHRSDGVARHDKSGVALYNCRIL